VIRPPDTSEVRTSAPRPAAVTAVAVLMLLGGGTGLLEILGYLIGRLSHGVTTEMWKFILVSLISVGGFAVLTLFAGIQILRLHEAGRRVALGISILQGCLAFAALIWSSDPALAAIIVTLVVSGLTIGILHHYRERFERR
jgi:hypothetical protein